MRREDLRAYLGSQCRRVPLEARQRIPDAFVLVIVGFETS